jgi:hypothetical protein
MIKILFFGDIVGKLGRLGIKKILPKLKKQLEPDLVIANVENLAHGDGATAKTLKEIQAYGINFFTSGNHIWAKKEVLEIFDKNLFPLIRPANYPPEVAGTGWQIVEIRKEKVLMINLIGRVFMHENFDCPFRKFDEIWQNFKKEKLAGIVVDFHTEATSEKVAFAHYVAGRVSAVLGTHTHVATCDLALLDNKTLFNCDVGMVGALDSVIGVKKEEVIAEYLTQVSQGFKLPEKGPCLVNSVYFEINPQTQAVTKFKRIDKVVNVT